MSYGVAGGFPSTGSGQAITLATGTVGATLAATAQTEEFWVKPSVRTPQTLIQHGDPGADGWAIGIAPTNTPRGGRRKLFFQSHGLSVNSRIALGSGAWTMVDVTWDAAHVNFTVNGGAISKALNTPSGWTVPGPASDTALTLGPGAGAGGTSFDEVALFGSALTPGQIAAHYAATLLPQSLSAPVLAPLSGVRDGDALTLTPGSYSGIITPSEQWQRCDAGAVCSDIPGATGTSYTLTPEDVNDTIQVQESASNANGSTSVISDATDPVLARAPFITDQQPSVSGTPSAGQTLTGDAGHWGGTPTITFAYQWQRCDAAGANCVNIPGATSATYAVDGAADAGARLLVAVTATNAGGATTATSLATMTVPLPDTSPFGAPTPSGNTPTGTTPTDGNLVAPTQPCAPRLTPARARSSRLGTIKITLRLNANTRRATLRAKRGTVRSVTFKLDGKRLRVAKKTPFAVTLRQSTLRAGKHLLKALVKPRRGKSRTIALRLTVVGC